MKIRSLLFSAPMLALATGLLTVLAFAPFGYAGLQIVSLAVLFYLVLRSQTLKRTLAISWAYGFGWSVSGMYWLYITMHHYGHLPAWMAATAVALLALFFLGAFAALAMTGAVWLRQRWQLRDASFALLVMPATWTLAEWARGWLFTGLPWVASGYAHTSGPLAGYAPVIGVYGIGWISALIAACLALLVSQPRRLPACGIALVLVAGGYALQSIRWTTPHGAPISVRLLQGDVSQESKFDRDRIGASLALYDDMITAAPADLIATPETALPLFIHQLPPDYLPRLTHFAQTSHSNIALGLLISDGPEAYANSMIGIGAATPATLFRYDKHHLVPFGEFTPQGFHWFVAMLGIPQAEQTSGALLQMPFKIKDQWVLPNICFEDLFGEEIAAQLNPRNLHDKPQGTILLNISNLAWFDDSTAMPQHLQISQMRTLETGRPMLRATNTGATAVIGPTGQVLAVLPFLRPGVLAATVQGMRGNTPYILFGNAIMLALIAAALLSAWWWSRSLRKKPA
jgi:apolipoprotein N-acyltransferase